MKKKSFPWISSSQREHLKRRLNDEKKWLHLTLAIIVAFVVSVVPVFIFYMLSLMGVTSPPVIQLIGKPISRVRKYLKLRRCLDQLTV